MNIFSNYFSEVKEKDIFGLTDELKAIFISQKYKKEKSKGTKSKFSLFFMDYWSLRRDRYRRCSLC